MRFGLQINPYTAGADGNVWDLTAQAAQIVDVSGFDSVWVYDHVLYEGGFAGHPEPEPALECFTVLGALAAITRRVRLGQLVTAVPYRNPALVAKMATTLDHISHGRSILGLGAGWHRREYEGYGWGEFEPVPVRMRRLEEALKVILALWTASPASFDGEFYRLDAVKDDPPPIQRPHPPIMVGGSGERVSLRLAAQYAQMCNVSGGPERIAHLFEVLREHCERLGRPYADITRSVYITVMVGRDQAEADAKRRHLQAAVRGDGALAGTPEQLVEWLRGYAAAGCQHAILRMLDWAEIEPVRLFAEQVLPALQSE